MTTKSTKGTKAAPAPAITSVAEVIDATPYGRAIQIATRRSRTGLDARFPAFEPHQLLEAAKGALWRPAGRVHDRGLFLLAFESDELMGLASCVPLSALPPGVHVHARRRVAGALVSVERESLATSSGRGQGFYLPGLQACARLLVLPGPLGMVLHDIFPGQELSPRMIRYSEKVKKAGDVMTVSKAIAAGFSSVLVCG